MDFPSCFPFFSRAILLRRKEALVANKSSICTSIKASPVAQWGKKAPPLLVAHFRFRRRGGSGGVYTLPPPPFQPTAHELWPRFVLRGAARRQIKTVWPKCSAENVLTPEWRDNQRRRAIFNTLARIHIHPFFCCAGRVAFRPTTHASLSPSPNALLHAFHSFYCANVQAAVSPGFLPVFLVVLSCFLFALLSFQHFRLAFLAFLPCFVLAFWGGALAEKCRIK